MFVNDDEPALFLRYKFSYSMMRVFDGALTPTSFDLELELDVVDESLCDLAVDKMDHWIKEYASRSIAVSVEDLPLLLNDDTTPRFRNFIMLCPESPTDHHIAILLQSKLQALSGEGFTIGVVSIASKDGAGLEFTFAGRGPELLPSMDDWIKGDTWFEHPWWCRDDCSTMDTAAPDDADLSVRPAWALDVAELLRPNAVPTDAVQLRTSFAPRIIDGGDGQE